MEISKDVALVIQGGGTRGIYAAGVVDFFLDNDINFPYVIGTSAGALAATNYTSRDKERNKWCFTDGMKVRGFASISNFLFKKNYFDFHYLFYDIPKKRYFDWKTFKNNPINFVAAATSLETGEAAYFSNKELSTDDMLDGVGASASFPLLQRKPKIVCGKPYLDGRQSAPVPFKKPLADGYKKVVVLMTRDITYKAKPYKEKYLKWAKKLYSDYPAFLEAYQNDHILYNSDQEELAELERQGVALVIRPEVPPAVGIAEKNKKKLLLLYYQGYEDAKKHLQEIIDFATK